MSCKTEWCEGKERVIILCFPQHKNIRQHWTQFSEWMKGSYFYSVLYTLFQWRYRLCVKKQSLPSCPVQTDKTAAVSRQFFYTYKFSKVRLFLSLCPWGANNEYPVSAFLLALSYMLRCFLSFHLLSNVTLKYQEHWETELWQRGFIYDFTALVLHDLIWQALGGWRSSQKTYPTSATYSWVYGRNVLVYLPTFW